MITYKSRFLTRGEVWFDHEPDHSRPVDWIIYRQRSRPVPGARSRYFYTPVIDLSRSEEQLQAQLSRDTAYKIRRARERDKVVCECLDPNDGLVMDRFERVFNQWAALKGLPPLYRARLEGFAAAGVLDMSAARDSQGNVLVYHANYRDSSRAAGLELPSLYRASADTAERNLIGRANRYLVWSGILRYKAQGLRYFDFGGWYFGSDTARLKINEFKRGFGGYIERGYECEQILTLKGWVVTLATTMLTRLRRTGAGTSPASKGTEGEAVSPALAPASKHSPSLARMPASQEPELSR